MINLLFISNSNKMAAIKNGLQPMLKSRIDVVTDFDHGLRDVFEKRPATIVIQDQIAGVTGESVARHIQMLLGSSSPNFILVHEGNPKIRAINGLFEYLIDLTLPENKLIEDIQAALEKLLAPEWEKIFIAPKVDRAAVAGFVLPQEHRENAERLLEDFLSDLELSDSQAISEEPSYHWSEPQEDSPFLEDANELLERLQSEVSLDQEKLNVEPQPAGPAAAVEEPAETKPPAKSPAKRKTAPAAKKAKAKVAEPTGTAAGETIETLSEVPPQPEAQPETLPRSQLVSQPEAPPAPAPAAASPTAEDEPLTKVQPAVVEPVSVTASVVADEDVEAPAVEPAPLAEAKPESATEFKILPDPHDPEIPEEILAAFEQNYRSQQRTGRYIVVGFFVVFAAVLGGVLYLKQGPQPVSPPVAKSPSPISAPVAVQKPAPSAPAAQKVAPGVAPVAAQKIVSSSRSMAATLPSFIPVQSRDRSFSARRPGWERYVGNTVEYRIFKKEQKLKAIQILASGAKPVSDEFLKQTLKEITGSSQYQINSKVQKQGFLIQRGTVDNKADVLIYRTQKGAIRAFVVSPS